MSLTQDLSNLAAGLGIDLIGFADLARAREAIHDQWGDLVSGYPRALSLGISLPDPIVNRLPERSRRAVRLNYRHHAYDVVNQRLDLVASEIASSLKREGFRALQTVAKDHVKRILKEHRVTPLDKNVERELDKVVKEESKRLLAKD